MAAEPTAAGQRYPGRRIAGALLLGLLAPIAGGCTTTTEQPPVTQSASGSSETGTVAVPDIPRIVDEVQPSMVTIFAGTGLGSGVIYAADGLILTNEHVVRGSTEVEVAFADGQRVAGTVSATDALTDLALVRAERTGLPAAEFEPELPQVGEPAVVLGSPLGFENTVTAGIISGLHREIPGSARNSQALVDLIQTDAAISPGNSGGAVVNGEGKVIGISEAYIPPQSGAVALGFAIPAATAVEVAEQLRGSGTVEHAFMGLVPAAVTPQIAERLGLPDTEGVVVLSTVNGGPADAAGILPGDVLISLNGEALGSPEDLLAVLRGLSPADTVPAEIRRGGETKQVRIALTGRPAG